MLSELRRRFKHALLSRWRVPHSLVNGLSPTVYRLFNTSAPIVLVDVGAHSGAFTRGMKQVCAVKQAVLVEPIPAMAAQLRGDSELSDYVIFGCAASETSGQVEFFLHEHFAEISSILPAKSDVAGMAEILAGEPTKIVVETRTLDDIVGTCNVTSIDLLKIDVQGFEDRVLKGATQVLAVTKIVFIEVSFRPLYEGSCTFFDVYRHLVDHGFALLNLEPGYRSKDGELLQADAIFQRA
jgi:FkbM family methyltransferase